ncbi:desmoglein-2.1-like [Garra rufa]|uniref:desmoglein-2.1-like n=1 Tax=Garra rufa TaxID=137080 RepID=UPI003CCEBA00
MQCYISQMRSDNDENVMLRYTLRGPGTNQPPVGTFIINAYTGLVRITRPLDREERQNYTLIGTAWYTNNTIAEDNVRINIIVEDQNDNPPVFIKPERSSVYEGSPVGTSVTQVVAKDADEPNTLHTKIAYSLIKQEPNDGKLYFAVDKDDGTITVSNPTLDREEHRSFVLTMQAADMYGSPEGNSATATVIIDILDVNDNIPTLEKDEFSASVDENEAPVEVLRIQALDNDEERTDNWLAEFKIISGDEDGRFSIETDPKTNMGILYLNKAVDFETASDMNLNLVVANKAHPGAPLGSGAGAGAAGAGGASGAGGGAGASGASVFLFLGESSSDSKQKSYPVKISVKNKPEAPKFMPKTKPISVSENTNNYFPSVIDNYTAIEEDTGKTAENVRYAKGYDPDNWISIDMETAEIKLNKAPDRESPFVVNGTYYAKILCISDDFPSETATGTIAIQVEDFNDHCPTVTSTVTKLCTDKDAFLVTAVDEDASPNGAPFTFNVVTEGTKGKWTVEYLNDTTAIFRASEKLWPGQYELMVDVKDQQGLSCPKPQKIPVEVCTCSKQGACAREGGISGGAGGLKRGSRLGLAGIGLLFLGLLSLLLIPLLMLICQCGAAVIVGAFRDMPFDTKEHLVSYHTEGQGEDRDVPVFVEPANVFVDGGGGIRNFSSREVNGMRMIGAGGAGGAAYLDSSSTMGGRGYNEMEMSYMDLMRRSEAFRGREMAGDFDGMALSHMFLAEYYSQNSRASEDGFAKNEPTVYDYEGNGSPVGSVGCCSILEDNNDLEFLNDLGPKFTTLADVCGGRKPEIPAPAPAPLPPAPRPIVNRTDVVSSSTNVISSGNIVTSRVPSNPVNLASNTATSTCVENVVVTDSRPTVIANVQPAPTLLMQPQPMYYMVEPQPSTVLLTERPAMGQNMYVLNSSPVGKGVVVQGGNIATNNLTRGERRVLVDRGTTSQAGLMHTSNLSRSQVLLVDAGANSGQVQQKLQREVAGSQGLMVVEGQGGQLIQGSVKKGVVSFNKLEV